MRCAKGNEPQPRSKEGGLGTGPQADPGGSPAYPQRPWRRARRRRHHAPCPPSSNRREAKRACGPGVPVAPCRAAQTKTDDRSSVFACISSSRLMKTALLRTAGCAGAKGLFCLRSGKTWMGSAAGRFLGCGFVRCAHGKRGAAAQNPARAVPLDPAALRSHRSRRAHHVSSASRSGGSGSSSAICSPVIGCVRRMAAEWSAKRPGSASSGVP